MIIELVGLPGAGKTALAEAMRAHGAAVVSLPSRKRLLLDSFLFWLAHPFLACRLIFCILEKASSGARYELFVNGYLGYAARYRQALSLSRQGITAVLDQGFFQMLISLCGLPSALLEDLPKPNVLVIVETDAEERERRMAARGWAPRGDLGTKVRLAWQEDAERALGGALPFLERSMPVYRHDGTQHPRDGATALMRFATARARTAVRTSFARNLLKTTLSVISYLFARFANIFSGTPEAVALMYHAIDHSGWKLSVTPEAFEQQMRYLARKGWTVPLADVVSYAKGEKKLPRRAVAVTFDDGYRDVLATALPILEQYRIPVTVFVPSDMSARTSPDGRPRLTEEELRILAQSPLVTIGSHAKSHRKFTELTLEEMRSEAKESADTFERVLGKHPTFFAYPFGARSADAERAVRDAGYEAAFGISEGLVHRGDDAFCLKRVQVDNTINPLLFRLRLTAAVDWNRRMVDALRCAS